MKKSRQRDKFYIKSIAEEIHRIEIFIKKETLNTFIRNIEKQYAIYKACENIGEAVKNISKDLKAQYPKVLWKEIAGFRDILSHEYFGVDIEEVWKIVSEDIPEFKLTIKKILKSTK